MTCVLDTNAVSAFMKGNARLLSHLEAVPRKDARIPEPVLAEIAYGIARLARSKRKDELAGLLRLVRETFVRAPWDDAVTDQFGAVKAALESRGERIEDFDIAVAAHALAADAVLVTANRSHMSRIPNLRVEDWSE